MDGHTTARVNVREWESGRIEARIGLRMMPTFPRSPLSFRTAGFPQYGWKAGFPSGAFLDDQRLKPAPGIRCPKSSLHPPFVHLVVSTVVPLCVGPPTRLRTAVEGYYSSARAHRQGRSTCIKGARGRYIAALTNKPMRPIERFRGSKQARFPPC